MIHNESYWTDRYEHGQTQWDTGTVTTPLKEYFDQLNDKSLKILIPGCGNAHEAEYLWANGFKNVFLADLSSVPLNHFKKQVPDFPEKQLLHCDFFDIKDTFDLIVEQTFFCALHPSERANYVQHMRKVLKPEAKLVGVLFNDELFKDHPPYGGYKEDYLPLFLPFFKIEVFEECYNSIAPRAGRELFIKLRNSTA